MSEAGGRPRSPARYRVSHLLLGLLGLFGSDSDNLELRALGLATPGHVLGGAIATS